MKALGIINRLSNEDKQTLGRFYLYNGVDEVFSCAVLELADKDNKTKISRICSGVYTVVKRWSKTYGDHYHLLDVEGRTLILIHFGNYYKDTEGCILVGSDFTDLDGDGYRDVTSSKPTMKKLLSIAPDTFQLMVHDMYLMNKSA